GHADNFMRF
uniref:FMRFamide-9 n=1 Tax=Sarcophaga bullata TaxID=7385 RepID=FAR9_SARBU|nr:RecName: Full=FMRFamide-9; AltName: Full=SabFMRFamide-9 [Sarcophaga bullata]